MGYNQKALHYCGTHTQRFLQKNCKNCGQGMCFECLKNHESFCPECIIELDLGRFSKNQVKEVMWMAISGIIGILLFFGYQFLFNASFSIAPTDYWYLLLSWVLGISIFGTYYLLRDSEIYKDFQKLPLVGFKLTILYPILVTLSTVPFFYFLYHLLSILWKSVSKKNI